MSNENTHFSIILSAKVKDTFERYKHEYQYSVEAGGILVGKIEDNIISIIDLTEPYEDDKRSKYAFKRASKGHQEYMDELWTLSGESVTYLGEWHTHDQKVIFPSPVDYINWKKIMSRSNNSEVLVFIILGRNNISIWIGEGDSIMHMNEVFYD